MVIDLSSSVNHFKIPVPVFMESSGRRIVAETPLREI